MKIRTTLHNCVFWIGNQRFSVLLCEGSKAKEPFFRTLIRYQASGEIVFKITKEKRKRFGAEGGAAPKARGAGKTPPTTMRRRRREGQAATKRVNFGCKSGVSPFFTFFAPQHRGKHDFRAAYQRQMTASHLRRGVENHRSEDG